MTTAAALRQALRERIAPLMEELRASTPTHDHDQRRTVAKQVEADSGALVEATAVDLELMLAELVPVEFHAVTLADPELIKWFPWESRQTAAGKLLRAWAGGAHPSRPLPEGVTPEEVATWMLPALKRHNHSLADDGPEDIPVEQWEAWSAERQRGITELRARMTPGQPLEEWGALNAEEEEIERAYEARVVEWENKANNSLVKVARGFTYPNGTKVPPSLRAPVLTHPVTGPWTWWPEAMVTLYLANPVTVAARCMRALERLDTRQTEEAHLSTARTALKELEVNDENMGRLAGDLADELRKRIAEARAVLDVNAVLESIRKPSSHTMLPWDEKAAAYFDGLSTDDNTRGRETAEMLRTTARTRWTEDKDLFRLWTPQQPHGAPLFAFTLAKVLWKDVVEPQLNRRERWLSPALAAQVYDRVTDAMTRHVQPNKDGTLVARDGRQMLLAIDSRVLTPNMNASGKLDRQRIAEMGEDGRLLEHGLSLVGSYNAHKLVRFVPRACLESKWRDPSGDFRVLRFNAYAELAEAAGMKGGKRLDDDVRALAYVYDAFRVTLDDGSNDRLWTRGEYMAKTGGRPRRAVTLTASPLLLPHTQEQYVDDSRWLIPLVAVPPVVGLEHAGQQASLQLLIVRHMRTLAAQMVERGGVDIPDAAWLELATKAGVPASLLPRVRERWLTDGEDGAAFLAKAGKLYTLAPAYKDALEFLRRGGQKTIAGRKGAKEAKAEKARRIGGGRKRKS